MAHLREGAKEPVRIDQRLRSETPGNVDPVGTKIEDGDQDAPQHCNKDCCLHLFKEVVTPHHQEQHDQANADSRPDVVIADAEDPRTCRAQNASQKGVSQRDGNHEVNDQEDVNLASRSRD